MAKLELKLNIPEEELAKLDKMTKDITLSIARLSAACEAGKVAFLACAEAFDNLRIDVSFDPDFEVEPPAVEFVYGTLNKKQEK